MSLHGGLLLCTPRVPQLISGYEGLLKYEGLLHLLNQMRQNFDNFVNIGQKCVKSNSLVSYKEKRREDDGK